MNRIAPLALCLAVVALVTGCGGPRTYNLTPQSAKDTIKKAPDWMVKPPTEDDALNAAATATSRDLQLAFDKARNIAQVDLAQQMGVRMANLTKQFQEEVGLAADSDNLTQFSGATKATTDETIVGARVARRELQAEGNIYRAYVLMSLPIGQANALLMQKLRANDSLYTRFRATEAYRELDEAIRRQPDGAAAALGQ